MLLDELHNFIAIYNAIIRFLGANTPVFMHKHPTSQTLKQKKFIIFALLKLANKDYYETIHNAVCPVVTDTFHG